MGHLVDLVGESNMPQSHHRAVPELSKIFPVCFLDLTLNFPRPSPYFPLTFPWTFLRLSPDVSQTFPRSYLNLPWTYPELSLDVSKTMSSPPKLLITLYYSILCGKAVISFKFFMIRSNLHFKPKI